MGNNGPKESGPDEQTSGCPMKPKTGDEGVERTSSIEGGETVGDDACVIDLLKMMDEIDAAQDDGDLNSGRKDSPPAFTNEELDLVRSPKPEREVALRDLQESSPPDSEETPQKEAYPFSPRTIIDRLKKALEDLFTRINND